MNKEEKHLYELPNQNVWKGRYDGDQLVQRRWWQHIELLSLENNNHKFNEAPVILGFASDEGVARNKGRTGSAKGPQLLRETFSNLPVHNVDLPIYDIGNIYCVEDKLEEAQKQLANGVQNILENNGFPLLIGGGHEILYGHYSGVTNHFKNKKVGIINFDAHFDIRKPNEIGVSSGTGFNQAAQDAKSKEEEFLYLALGIQLSGNTKELFDKASKYNVEYILAQDFHLLNLERIKELLRRFIAKSDVICLTIDMDVFSASIAPGVSAPSATGILYDYTFREVLKFLATNSKVVSIDIAEYNPKYDIDLRTAKLASQLIFDWVQWRW